MKLKDLTPLFILMAALSPALFTSSCANTTQAPTGGKKDSIAPALYWTYPAPGATGVPTEKCQFVFGFDEYVTIKNSQNIFLSPPLKKAPKSKIKKKSVMVWFEEPLQENTTYTLNFTNAIADNNEGNFFPGFTYVFSTGETIDSMIITGTVRDFETLIPIKDATVMLYLDQSDSAIFKERPFAATKTDDWGFFSLPYIRDTLYRLYAIKDENNDNLFQSETEKIAFVDSLIRPTTKIVDTMPELKKYDPKDTLECLARHSEYELNMFKENPTNQRLKNYAKTGDRSAYISFTAHDAWIDSLWISGIPADRLITQFNPHQDSLEIWVNDRRSMPDTFNLWVNYRKTDSLGVLQPELENVKLFIEGKAPKKKGRAALKDLKHEDTICVVKTEANPQTVEQYGFVMEFKYPIINESFDSLYYHYITPKQKDIRAEFSVEPDTNNLRRFTIRPKDKLLPGYEYILKVPERYFRDINGFYNDSTEVKVKLPSDDKLSTIVTEIKGVSGTVIVDLLDEKRTKELCSYTIMKDCSLSFPYLKEGKYSIRITSDSNGNGLIDTGNLLLHQQPEKVRFYKFEGDEDYIEIPKSCEMTFLLNIPEILAK